MTCATLMAWPAHAVRRRFRPRPRNNRGLLYVAQSLLNPREMRTSHVATDYDEVRSDVKETQENSLEALQSANAPDARSVVQELDEADGLDGAGARAGSSSPKS